MEKNEGYPVWIGTKENSDDVDCVGVAIDAKSLLDELSENRQLGEMYSRHTGPASKKPEDKMAGERDEEPKEVNCRECHWDVVEVILEHCSLRLPYR